MIAIQLTHPTHNSTHVMTPTWGGGQKPNMLHFMLTKCLDLFREVLRKYTTSNDWNDNNPEIISCFFVKVLLLGLKWKHCYREQNKQPISNIWDSDHIAESVVQARPWQCFLFLHVVQVCIDSNQVAFAIIYNCPMNNIGLRPTFKKKKTELYFSFDWIRPKCLRLG